jgi:hypothetical protein
MEKLGAGVRPALAGSDEHVVATEAIPQAIEHTEGVAVPIDPIVGIQDSRAPVAGDHAARRIRYIWLALALDPVEERDCVQDGAASGGSVEAHCAEQRRQELAHLTVAAQQVLVVVVLRRPCQGGHRRDGHLQTLLATGRREYGFAELQVGVAWVECYPASIVQPQRGGIQIAQTRLVTFILDAR